MTEQAKYTEVLYMNYRCRKTWYGRLDVFLKENPQLTTLLNDPTVQTEKEKYNWKNMGKNGFFSSSFLKKHVSPAVLER